MPSRFSVVQNWFEYVVWPINLNISGKSRTIYYGICHVVVKGIICTNLSTIIWDLKNVFKLRVHIVIKPYISQYPSHITVSHSCVLIYSTITKTFLEIQQHNTRHCYMLRQRICYSKAWINMAAQDKHTRFVFKPIISNWPKVSFSLGCDFLVPKPVMMHITDPILPIQHHR